MTEIVLFGETISVYDANDVRVASNNIHECGVVLRCSFLGKITTETFDVCWVSIQTPLAAHLSISRFFQL